jgi:serine/threonine protein kinase
MSLMTCPSQEDLLDFHLGRTPFLHLEEIGDHLETCLDCQERTRTLDLMSDEMVDILRGAPAPTTLIRAHGNTITEAGFSFLSPPQGPDELGRMGHYRVQRLLGRGAMGIVFAAEDGRLSRVVALKVMRPSIAEEPEARQRFLREARAMAAMGASPHLAPIYEVGEANGLPFLAMEYLEGESLDRWLARHKQLGAAEIIQLGREIAAGLAAAHARGLVHRDIKPANLWVQAPQGGIKVLDFGLARPAKDTKLTQTGIIAGTPAYLSPEQAQDQPLDARSDLFSVGCVLYEVCAGRVPFQGRNALALLTAVTTVAPSPLRNLRPDLPPALTDLVMELLSKRPVDRPASAQELMLRLDEISQGKTAPRSPARWPLTYVLTGLAAAVLLLVVGPQLLVRTSKGLVEIRTDDPTIRVSVEKDGELITILDPVGNQKIELVAGDYHVKLMPDNPDAKLSTDKFSLVRGGQEVLTVKRLNNIPKAADEAWVRRVANMPPDEQIKAVIDRLCELNPDYKADVRSRKEGGFVVEWHMSTENVADISALRALTGLQRLTCAGARVNRPLSSLAPLQGLKLKFLDCSFTDVADLSPLVGMPLEELICRDTRVKDLTPLRGMDLQSLSCDSTRVTDLSPLSGSKLTFLNCRNTEIATLAGLKGCKLTRLYCDNTKVKDLDPLRGMKLIELNCGVTAVASLAPLEGMKLKFLGFGQSEIEDLSPLKGMNIETLWANHCHIKDLSPLQGMDMKTMWCGTTKVTDLKPLLNMPLRDVGFDLKSDTDLTPLWPSRKTLTIINGRPAADFWMEHGFRE